MCACQVYIEFLVFLLKEVENMFGFLKKGYMEWEDYIARINAIERLLFVSETAEQSIKNYWSKKR